MEHTYIPRGICPVSLRFELDGDKVKNIQFRGGCSGNLKALSILLEGRNVNEISDKLAGIRCGMKSTSCADQLAAAVNKALEEEKSC